MDYRNKKISLNKRLFYFLIFLVIALAAVAAVLGWYFTKKSYEDCSLSPATEAVRETTTIHATTPATTTTEGPSMTEPWKNLRLPSYITPSHYHITLYPDFYGDHGTFYGKEKIEVHISEDAKYILVHINGLNLTKTALTYSDSGNSISISQTFNYEKNQFWVIETSEYILAGSNVTIELDFVGSLTRSIVGFYKSTYVNSITNETRNLATSKFEPVSARRAFPCFDEPNIKAEYSITLVHQDGYIALSNMPAEETVPSTQYPGLKETLFRRSVKMSTYLVCFIVCDFTYTETMTSTGVQVRVYATPDKVDQTHYALEVVNYTTAFYEELFGVKFPLPKLDMIAIPDFVSGAMEHWGLITYRETNILYNKQEASTSNKQRVGSVIAHEVAHQWFGNIVTMDWWDDLWLNEGFASFMEYIGLQDFEPEWEMPSQFLTQDFQYVMKLDANPESHPIIVPVNEPNEINEVFDTITYSKGASIIRMLEVMMGHDNFFDGIGRYLRKHQWGNAKTDDLWNVLGNVDGAGSVKDIMDTWTLQMGLPYINVTFEERDGQNIVKMEQMRFLADKNIQFDAEESPFNTVVAPPPLATIETRPNTHTYKSRVCDTLPGKYMDVIEPDGKKSNCILYEIPSPYEWSLAVDYVTSETPKAAERKWLIKDNGRGGGGYGVIWDEVKTILDEAELSPIWFSVSPIMTPDPPPPRPVTQLSCEPNHRSPQINRPQHINGMGVLNVNFNPMVENKWIKLNHKQTGYYRVNYPDFMWRRFASALQNSSIEEQTDRSGLVSDVFNLARAGYIGYDVALDVSKYLIHERSYLPWESAEGDLIYISSMLFGNAEYAEWMKFVLHISKPVLERLTWQDGGDHLERLHRINMIGLVCRHGDSLCLNNATELFRDWLDNGVTVVPNLRSLVYRYGMENSKTAADDWDKMWQKYMTETIPQERTKLLYGMSKTREIWLLARFLDYSKDGSKVRGQDFFTVLSYISDNPVGNALVWDWVRANWNYLVKRFTLFSRSLGRLLPRIIRDYNTDFKLSEVKAFFEQYPEAGAGERGRKQAIENIKTNIAWMSRNKETISNWLTDNKI